MGAIYVCICMLCVLYGTYVCMYVFMCVVCICVCVSARGYMCMYVCICTCACVRTHVGKCANVYMICIYVRTHFY